MGDSTPGTPFHLGYSSSVVAPWGRLYLWKYLRGKKGKGGFFSVGNDGHSFSWPFIQQQTQQGDPDRALCGFWILCNPEYNEGRKSEP